MSDAVPISSTNAPPPNGPYSQAIAVDGFVFCSGQVGASLLTGALVEGIEAQTRQSLDNLMAVLQGAGLTLDAIVKATIFLIDINDFATVNMIYGERMGTPPPARSTIAVAALPRGARIEIEAIARAGP